ncbi:AsmA family protein [Zobellella endophytica]|uniref:AsmA family protein n=1 Tax=Zobellella endophytica TaxID=2116700 RepID=A0A2P7RC35_9GAMM|nr:AsmA family protein [Zobellella endophytica]PSJ47797.1 AsmA family protein [Zobellella endophytica]
MKKLLYVIAALLLLVVAGLLVMTQLVDTERVKRVMIEQTREKTGRTLVIDGDLSWRFFPSLGFTLGRTALLNPPGFAEGATLSIGEVSLDVALRPLFDHRLEIGEAVLSNARLHLITRADGVSNIDDLRALSAAGEPAGDADEQAAAGEQDERPPMSFSLAGIRVADAEVVLQNEASNTLTRVNKVNLELAAFAPGQAVPLRLSGNLFRDDVQANIGGEGRLWLAPEYDRLRLDELVLNVGATGRAIPGNKQLQLQGSLAYDLDRRLAQFNPLALQLGALDVTGELSLRHRDTPEIRFALATGMLDVDALLAEWRSTQGAAGEVVSGAEVTLPTSVAAAEPDLSWLRGLDVQGRLTAEQVRAQGMELEQLTISVQLEQGKLSLDDIQAALYEGRVEASGELDVNSRPARFSVQKRLTGVNARKLLDDAMGLDYLEGRADLTVALQGRGLSAGAIKRSVSGSSHLEVTDGALHGVNIPAMIRRGYAQVKGQPLPAEEAVQKTDFSALNADFDIGDGKIGTDNLTMASPLLRIEGKGEGDLLDESLDVLLNTSVVGSLKGQDGEELTELKNITLPVRISGTYQDPRYGLDMQQVFDRYLRDKVDREAERLQQRLNEKLGDELGDKLQQRLPGLLDKLGL